MAYCTDPISSTNRDLFLKRENSNSKTLILKDISTIKQLINAESGIKRDKVYNMLPTAI